MSDKSQNSRGHYGCFLHPSTTFELKRLTDKCPACQQPYGFPITTFPKEIRDFSVEKALSRGFYGAIYVAKRGPLNRKYVLKVIPTAVYSFHNKNFADECQLHNEVASGIDHVVGISDFFDQEVSFGETPIPCHIAVLDYIDGEELDEFLKNSDKLTARALAQLATDVFRLLQALDGKGVYHNDLHHKNLLVQSLPSTQYRPEAIDETIRLMAVDLGSLADRSRSGPPRQALGDLTSAATFLVEFADLLLTNPDDTPDSDYRLASALVELASHITGRAENIRTPNYHDFIDQIYGAFVGASSPWRRPVGLRRLNDAYNAQTLHPYFVPRLLVDPGGEWLSAISVGGPQVITGVRGCGKTMLLRALEFHARISGSSDQPDGINIDSLQRDGYVGLYLSARRLLDALGNPTGELHEPHARLLLGFARQGVRAGRHLAEIDSTAVRPQWWAGIGTAVAGAIAGAEAKGVAAAVSPTVLERRLHALLASLDRGESEHRLISNPSIAFPALAEAVQSASPVWETSTVLFLLDDVSTRHLEEGSIVKLLGTLLFGDDRCAFKLTTEGQTLELGLRSPGLIERARAGRDYEPFDLAARVNERLKHSQEGKTFLAKILKLRATQFVQHPDAEPVALLGDTPLESVARHIAATGKTAGERKKTYWGLSVLTAMCVGDIGDVLNIYDSILRKNGNNLSSLPIPAQVQNEAFQEYSSRRLYHLNRRKGELKDYAISFAEAAHDLLQRSACDRNGKQPNRKRLRQYAQIYVRVTTGDEQAQFNRLRELIDAGVFVLERGVDAPRKKTRDADPISQFILTYRKLFGLTQYIGLAFSDRFELSGTQLQEWLSNPADGKKILMKNLGGELTIEEVSATSANQGVSHSAPAQMELPATQISIRESEIQGTSSPPTQPDWTTLDKRMPLVREVRENDVTGSSDIRSVVLGLGFEERCMASTRTLFDTVGTVDRATVVRYREQPFSDEIEALVRRYSANVHVIDYEKIAQDTFAMPSGQVVVDVTGLAKPAIFHAIRQALLNGQRAYVAHTHAQSHYPSDADIAKVFESTPSEEIYEILERAGQIWSGEKIPYSFVPLLTSDVDDSRHCLLCAAVSAKHERLLSLMEERTYDAVDILAPDADTHRSKLAQLAADVATRGIEPSQISRVDSNDLSGTLTLLKDRFRSYYLNGGFSVEFGLTGSKMHAVACAVASTAFKVGQVWYVSPRGFDPNRFTEGTGETRWYVLERQS